MFFPREMTEVELIVPSKDLVAVAKVLSGRGVFHQVDSTYLGLESLGPSAWQEKAGNYFRARTPYSNHYAKPGPAGGISRQDQR